MMIGKEPSEAQTEKLSPASTPISTKEIEKMPSSLPVEKTFEGGFFSVSSPASAVKLKSAEPLRTRHSLLDSITKSFTESSPRRLSTRTSLRMLSVRNSMGSICKVTEFF